MLLRHFGLMLAALHGAACDNTTFVCASNDECSTGRHLGVCEAEGFCSFSDAQCDSGRVWGEHAPETLANECVPPTEASVCVDLECTTTDPAEPTPPNVPFPEPRAPQRDDEPAERDAPASPPDAPADEPVAPGGSGQCADGERNGDETDVDCGGSCNACSWCAACNDSGDCEIGTCEAGVCRTIEVLELDWLSDCGHVDDLMPVLALPPGTYLATALPSAGSKWSYDAAAGGLTWGWRIDCDGASFGDLRTPTNVWYATPEDAYAALLRTSTLVEIDADTDDPETATLECGIADSYCDDNRDGVAVRLENWCP